MSYKILLVEDDSSIREIIEDSFGCKEPAISVTSRDNGTDALFTALNEDFDAIILDVMLPDIDGFSIMRSIRKSKDVPVIFLTARGREEDIIYGYELGCDDYIIKPFVVNTLYLKVLALIKRDKKEVISSEHTIGKISINEHTFTVKADGKEVELPNIEYKMLCLFFNHPNFVFTRNALLDNIWGLDYYGSDRVVDNHIKKLRGLLGEAGSQIKTVISKGYKFVER